MLSVKRIRQEIENELYSSKFNGDIKAYADYLEEVHKSFQDFNKKYTIKPFNEEYILHKKKIFNEVINEKLPNREQ